MSPNLDSSLNSSPEGRKFKVAVIEVRGGFSKQGLHPKLLNACVSSTRIGFKLWNSAVILPLFISETYLKNSFSRQVDHSFKNWFSGPLSYRVPWETALRTLFIFRHLLDVFRETPTWDDQILCFLDYMSAWRQIFLSVNIFQIKGIVKMLQKQEVTSSLLRPLQLPLPRSLPKLPQGTELMKRREQKRHFILP